MSPLKIAAVVLIVGGVVALVYGSFTYVSEVHNVDLGVMNATWSPEIASASAAYPTFAQAAPAIE